MAKHKSFAEILETELRWPRQGDRPFVVAVNSLENANVAGDKSMRLVAMIEGYKKAADLMVAASIDDETTRNMLVFPIIFSYRQFLELALKYQIGTYGPPVGIEPIWNTHLLDELWARFKEVLKGYGTEDPDEADSIVADIILEFAKIDPNSQSYRYPVDRNGNQIPVAYEDLHLPTLADVMNAVAGYFTGCDGFLDARRDAISA